MSVLRLLTNQIATCDLIRLFYVQRNLRLDRFMSFLKSDRNTYWVPPFDERRTWRLHTYLPIWTGLNMFFNSL